MADIKLSRLEEKFQLLMKKMQFLQEENQRLGDELNQKSSTLSDQQKRLEELEHQLTTRQIADKTTSGGEESVVMRGELKRALNKYIREIDHCIAELNK